MDRRTARRTDIPSYRDAWMHLKKEHLEEPETNEMRKRWENKRLSLEMGATEAWLKKKRNIKEIKEIKILFEKEYR